MQRAGTTLVERILGRHSALEAAGELQILRRLSELAGHQIEDGRQKLTMFSCLSDDQLASIGQQYARAAADGRRSDRPYLIDKNNLNWMQIGLILLALPQAKIIDVRRNALDCCWANFKMLFARGVPAANDLRHIGLYYRDYVRLINGMQNVAPDRILTVRYEDVVDDIEVQTQRALDFLGLKFEPQCLDFHLLEDPVATASSEQVRQPLNRRGIGASQPYAQWLGPLREALGPLADA
jgi:hypothetical protein